MQYVYVTVAFVKAETTWGMLYLLSQKKKKVSILPICLKLNAAANARI